MRAEPISESRAGSNWAQGRDSVLDRCKTCKNPHHEHAGLTAWTERIRPPGSGARYGTARNRCRKIAQLSRRYGFRPRTDFQFQAVLIR
ncbi:hypothetical protein EVAR_50167_1 [Eumeta japonica]|uniref:Uncharacterized protein n=1 Tax=Eumeta variegata TaxID=151549 RepID=A0A4C1YTM4_EUMVA|nr:hypothetical protein EVAR_50167_1 [Eumeta japonica]